MPPERLQIPAAQNYLRSSEHYFQFTHAAAAHAKEGDIAKAAFCGAATVFYEIRRAWQAPKLIRALRHDGDQDNHPPKDELIEERYGIVAAIAVGVLKRAGIEPNLKE